MIIGSKLYRTHETSDSMAWAKEHLHDAPDGAVFLADLFTQARGRQGRSWQVGPGQLMVTFLLKPKQLGLIDPDNLTIRLNQLTMALALGILEPLKVFGVQLKWPNDFVVQHKKVGGMLVHVLWSGEKPVGIVVGFAINVNNEFAPDNELFPIAISLKTITGSVQEIRPLYKNMLVSLNDWYERWTESGFMQIYKSWKEQQAYIGTILEIHQKDGSLIKGTAQQVLPNGDLLLIDQNKKQMIISFYQVDEIKITH